MSSTRKRQLVDYVQLQHYYHEFIPIQDTASRDTTGYDVVLRSDYPEGEQQLINDAKEYNLLFDLEISSIILALETWQKLFDHDKHMKLYFHVSPQTIKSPGFPLLIRELSRDIDISPQQIMFIITEGSIAKEWQEKTIQYLTGKGFTFSIPTDEKTLQKWNDTERYNVKKDPTDRIKTKYYSGGKEKWK